MTEDFYDDARERAAKRGQRIERDWTDAEKVQLANERHLWINAFALIRPDEATLVDIGRSVVRMLQSSPMVDDLSGSAKMVYIRVNAS